MPKKLNVKLLSIYYNTCLMFTFNLFPSSMEKENHDIKSMKRPDCSGIPLYFL